MLYLIESRYTPDILQHSLSNLKVQKRRFEIPPICSRLYKRDNLKISHS